MINQFVGNLSSFRGGGRGRGPPEPNGINAPRWSATQPLEERDDRSSGSDEAPAVWVAYTPDRRNEHPQLHLAGFKGVPQTDEFAG